ncbi:MAG: hypothetical protein ACK4UJ_04370 [Leptonema sp. (in: bacteria)]
MNAELNFYRKIFIEFLPLWAERGGYLEGFYGSHYIYPETISKIPIQFAPASSLDGLFIDIENSPTSPQLLTSYIQTLSPGGILVAHLKKEFWNKKTILNTLKVAGFEIIYLNKIPNYQIKKIDKNFFKPKGLFYRFFLETFPFSIMSLKSHWFIIAKKHLSKNKFSDFLQFSIVIPIENRESVKKVFLWEEFFHNRKIYNVELVIVEHFKNHNIEIPESNFLQMQIINHNLETSLESCIYTGVYHSKGKIVLVDNTKEAFKPEIFFELLDQYLRHIDPSKPIAVYAYPKGYKNKFIKKIINFVLYGISIPESSYRMYNLKSVEIFFRFHPFLLKKKSNLIEKEIRKQKGKILFIPYPFDYTPLKKKF